MVTNGSFLHRHSEGFRQGVAAGWEAGYRRALKDTGITVAGSIPEVTGVNYEPPVKADLGKTLQDCRADDEISVRAFNCLHREGFHTVGDLIDRTEEDLFDIRNLGAKTIGELKAFLASQGLALKATPDTD